MYIVINKDRFILMSTPIDWKLGRWYNDATKIQPTYLKCEFKKKTTKSDFFLSFASRTTKLDVAAICLFCYNNCFSFFLPNRADILV